MSDPQGWNHWEKKQDSGFEDRREGLTRRAMKMTPADPNPWGAYYFGLEIDGISEVAHFAGAVG